MIVLVSSFTPERAALASLCQARQWVHGSCESVATLTRFLRRNAPRVAVIRQRLTDGMASEAIAALRSSPHGTGSRCIVLVSADSSSTQEARLIELGVDCTLRDPIRPEVLLAYLERWMAKAGTPAAPLNPVSARPLALAGAVLDPLRRSLTRGSTSVTITPREVELAEILARSDGEVVTYEMLYAEILGRPFQGNTTNLRVLLGKLTASLRTVGSDLTHYVEVISKVGYRVHRRTPKRSAQFTAKVSRAA